MPTKQEILDEIRRTAADNGGRPLGSARFERETGIKEYDWGKYWPRLGDAQREAGFEPNQRQSAHADDLLVEKLVALTRKLGKFPTSREIEVERRTDPQLPTAKAYRRLGGKVQLAHLALAFCAERPTLDDVVSICSAVVPHDPADSLKGHDSEIGEVYLFKAGKFYKIGKTNDTVRRGAEIRLQLPAKPVLVHSIKTDDPSGIELYWHRRFDSKRMNGEWFDLNPSDVRAFKRWRRIY